MSEPTSRIRALCWGGAREVVDHDGARYPPRPTPASPLRVLVHPHIDEANTYLQLLTDALGALGVESRPFSWRRLLRGDFSILHVHWPELAVGPRALWKACAASLLLVLTVAVARLRHMALIWTVHNVGSHEQWHPRLERILLWWWSRQVDGLLTLSNWAHQQTNDRHERLREAPWAVVAHGNYPVSPRPERDDARRLLGVDRNARIALHFGHLRPYKGTDRLLRAFTATALEMNLLVTGRARPASYARELVELAGRDPRVRLEAAQVSAERLSLLLAACDVVVLPYRRVTHSGSVLHALAACRPVITTATGSMPELQRQVTPSWIHLIDPLFDHERLARALEEITTASRGPEPALPQQDWNDIALRTRALYDEALARQAERR